MSTAYLEFESRIKELDDQIAQAESQQHEIGAIDELRRSRDAELRDIYDSLSPWHTVLVSRHQQRPQSLSTSHQAVTHCVQQTVRAIAAIVQIRFEGTINIADIFRGWRRKRFDCRSGHQAKRATGATGSASLRLPTRHRVTTRQVSKI